MHQSDKFSKRHRRKRAKPQQNKAAKGRNLKRTKPQKNKAPKGQGLKRAKPQSGKSSNEQSLKSEAEIEIAKIQIEKMPIDECRNIFLKKEAEAKATPHFEIEGAKPSPKCDTERTRLPGEAQEIQSGTSEAEDNMTIRKTEPKLIRQRQKMLT